AREKTRFIPSRTERTPSTPTRDNRRCIKISPGKRISLFFSCKLVVFLSQEERLFVLFSLAFLIKKTVLH
ncbi:hypothetical protein CSUI_008272, partial [Cystoisospora suis]